jgi:hypothetical protein
MAKIFVSIASYRDPELLPTLKDLIANAKKLPTNIHPNAPERVEMPVIDAGKGDLTAVLQKLNTGELDFKPPYSPEVSKDLKGGAKPAANPTEKEPVKEHIQEIKRLQKLAGIIK